MSDGMSLGQLMQVSAWGLGLGTLFFSFFGHARPRDFFLTIGLVACVAGNLAFIAFLAENDDGGGLGGAREAGKKGNDTMVTLFGGLALFALYGLSVQLWKYKRDGFLDDEDDDDDDAEEAEKKRRAAAAAATEAGRAARPGVEPPDEAAAEEAEAERRRGTKAKVKAATEAAALLADAGAK
jgi:hypothetical protein